MRVNRLNPVQKATYFLKKSYVGTSQEYTVAVKIATDQCHRFRAISALISAASNQKWIGILS